MNQDTRPWYFWPVIAFLVGLLVGWLVIGWLVWPVKWTNAQLVDLRPDLRYEYVSMVADSYAQTRNIEQARGRLSGWSADGLAQDLSEAQGVLVARNNVAAAQNLQELAGALGADLTAAQAGQPQPAATAQTQVQPTAAAADGGSSVSNLRQICTAGLFILLALGALALLVFLFRRWRATSGGGPSAGDTDYEEIDTVSAAEEEKSRWPAAETFVEEDRPARGGFATPPVRPYMPGSEDAPAANAPTAEPTRPIPLRPVGQVPAETPRNDRPRNETSPVIPSVPAGQGGSLRQVAQSTAVYQMGEPDYDEAFDITDPTDGFMGQYGLQLIEPFGRDRDQAVALQAWLWDTSDPDTQFKVLMSEGAYRDTALRSQHAGEHEALAVRPGYEFEMTTHDLVLKGRVEKASYAEAEPPRGIFADLHVKMTVYRRS